MNPSLTPERTLAQISDMAYCLEIAETVDGQIQVHVEPPEHLDAITAKAPTLAEAVDAAWQEWSETNG